MEKYQSRLRIGAALMAIGFVAELVMLTGLVFPEREPSWFWGLFLLIGVGSAVVVSAFTAAAKDRRIRTTAALGGRPGRRR